MSNGVERDLDAALNYIRALKPGEIRFFELRSRLETEERWSHWRRAIPAIEFRQGWRVRVVPPFGGAIARFEVIEGDLMVSVFLDCYDRLGWFGTGTQSPYWQVHPYKGASVDIAMDDSDGLVERIAESFAQRKGTTT